MKSKKKCNICRFKPVFFAWFSFRVSCIVDGKRIQFGIGILTKRICYYPILLVNRYFLTNDYYSPISITSTAVSSGRNDCCSKQTPLSFNVFSRGRKFFELRSRRQSRGGEGGLSPPLKKISPPQQKIGYYNT